MTIVTQVLVALVAALHVYFLVLEMFLWTKPAGLQAFDLDPDFAERTKALAGNQGLYNGFLAAGLLWGLASNDTVTLLFFLGCVVIAGVYGAMTVSNKILLVQAGPGILAMLAVIIGSW
jgi:putative membrane protein